VMKEDAEMETVLVSGITYNKDEAKISVIRVPDKPGIASQLFSPLSHANITVDMIIQNVSHEGYTDLTFTVPRTDFKKAMKIVEETAREIGAGGVQADENIAKVSIVGVGMRSHSGIASKMFQTFSQEGINIQMISTSEIKVSCIIDSKYTELAVRVLHEAFGLAKKDVTLE
jgi:aspartate kinase